MLDKKSIIKASNVLSVLFTIITPIVTAYCTKKCIDKINKKNKKMNKKEVIKTVTPFFIAPALLTISNVLLNVSTTSYFNKKIAGLYSAALATSSMLIEQEKKTKELYGEDSVKRIKEEIAKDKLKAKVINICEDNKELYYLYDAHTYFTATPYEVLISCYELNRLFILKGYVSLNDFITILKGYTNDPNLEPIESYGDDVGWSQEAGGTVYGYGFIDFSTCKTVLDNDLECNIIYFPFEPTVDYLELELYPDESNPYPSLK